MDYIPGAARCHIWQQKHYCLYEMIKCLDTINTTTRLDLLWFVLHENHLDDGSIQWLKANMEKYATIKDPVAKRLASAICDALLDMPLEERAMVIYPTYRVTAETGYCIRNYHCKECQINKLREERIDKEEKDHAASIFDQTGLSESCESSTLGDECPNSDS